ncbi:hypothetical protein [Lewinella cohaerens]|uniref:hypothetical protein n=1 Tax=Lewinella cohaerens TaxID=70995 RepID=UPI000379DCA2|nr:hypothetical protein [Lewinella cohaerens]
MDYNTAKTLLNRYFEGNTSLTEEEALRSYFKQEVLPEDMEPYRSLFQFFAIAGEQKVSEEFSARLDSIQKRKASQLVQFRKPMSRWLAIAAMITLALAVWILTPEGESNKQQATIDWSQFEPKSEEEAIRVTTTAFQKTSASLRRGMNVATSELQSVKKLVQPW